MKLMPMSMYHIKKTNFILPALALISLVIFAGILTADALFAAEIIVAPNPWIPESQKVATGNLTDGISFHNLPESGEILIYTVTGELVKRIEFSNNSSGTARWLGKNDEDEYVSSGVYLWILKDQGKTGKLIIIR